MVTHRSSRAMVYLAAGFAALGGLLFGYDTGVISGAQTVPEGRLRPLHVRAGSDRQRVLVGAATGSLLGGRLADIYGRRHLLLVTAVIFAVGALVCAAATSPAILIVGPASLSVSVSGWRREPCPSISPKCRRLTPGAGRYRCFSWRSPWASCSPTGGLRVQRRFAGGAGCSALRRSRGGVCRRNLVPAGEPALAGQSGRRAAALEALARVRGTADVHEELNEIVEPVRTRKSADGSAIC